MEQRLSLVTLGVADLARARAFYEALGWRIGNDGADVAFFQLPGSILALWSRESLAHDAGLPDAGGSGFSGVALAYNARSRDDVDAVLNEVVKAGAKLLKPGTATFWGGYSGYFTDPDGHLWEVAHNPFWSLDAGGRVTMPPAPAA